MRKSLAALLLVGALSLASPQPAQAITWGEPDTNNQFIYAGMIITPINDVEGEICSGFFLDRQHFVTAAHCLDEGAFSLIYIGLQPDLGVPVGFTFLPGGVQIHPDFVDTGIGPDVAVVSLFFPLPFELPFYGQLPTAGVLEESAQGPVAGRAFDVVGYGTEGVSAFKGEGKLPPEEQTFGIRQFGQQSLLNLTSNNTDDGNYAQFSANDGIVAGGACLGDSGGPVVTPGSNQVVALNSFGTNLNCAGIGFAARLDTQSVLDFINGVINTPQP